MGLSTSEVLSILVVAMLFVGPQLVRNVRRVVRELAVALERDVSNEAGRNRST